MSIDQLYLHEEILLWVLKNEKGTIHWRGGHYQNIMAGAIIAELMLRNKIKIDDVKKKIVHVLDAIPLGDPVLDEALEQLCLSKKNRPIEHWLEKFAYLKKMKHRVAEKLCHLGILKKEESTVLFFFKVANYPELNPIPEQKMIARVRQAVLDKNTELDIRTTILISLLYKTELLPIAIPPKEIKVHKKHIKEIIAGEKIGAATQEVIDAVNTAIMIATIVPAMAASTAVAVSSS